MNNLYNIAAIIPARYASTRFPGKPLVEIQGKTMIQRVYEQASKVVAFNKVIVATDDQRIFDHVLSFGGEVEMTASYHASGTDRCAEVAAKLQDIDIVINIQGDEPFIQPVQIEAVINPFLKNKNIAISTLAKKLEDIEAVFYPNVVKVVFNQKQEALYFSRNPIPFVRGVPRENWLEKANFYKHIGLYGFKKETLLKLAQLPKGKLEQVESLEQLRWLEAGYSIYVGLTDLEAIGIDTPEDLERWLGE